MPFWRRAVCTLLVPSVMNPVVSITSCAAVLVVRSDASSSRFYLSMEDALMRIFASDRISGMMRKLRMKPGEAIEHPWVTKAIANAQRKVESRSTIFVSSCWNMMMLLTISVAQIYSQRNRCWTFLMSAKPLTASANYWFQSDHRCPYPAKSLEEM